MKSDEKMNNEKVTSSTQGKKSNSKLRIDFHGPKKRQFKLQNARNAPLMQMLYQ